MRITDLKGMDVLDKDAKEIGKVEDVDFDTTTGQIEDIIISLKSGIFSKDKIEIKFSDLSTIGDYVILKGCLPEKSEQVKPEKD